jgi:hypothetical protein
LSSNIFNNNTTSIVYSFTHNGFLQFWSLFVVQVLLALQTSHIFFSACLVYLKSTANRGSIIHPKKNSFTTFFAYMCACVCWCRVCTTFFPFPPRVFGAYACARACWCTECTSGVRPFGSSLSSSLEWLVFVFQNHHISWNLTILSSSKLWSALEMMYEKIGCKGLELLIHNIMVPVYLFTTQIMLFFIMLHEAWI